VSKKKKSNDAIGNRNRDLPACNAVPQSTATLKPNEGEELVFVPDYYNFRRDSAFGSCHTEDDAVAVGKWAARLEDLAAFICTVCTVRSACPSVAS